MPKTIVSFNVMRLVRMVSLIFVCLAGKAMLVADIASAGKPKLSADFPVSRAKYPLHYAVSAGDLRGVMVLLKNKKSDLNQLDSHGLTPLVRAIVYNKPAIFDRLMAAGANVRLPQNLEFNPLAISVAMDCNSCFNKILSRLVDISAHNRVSPRFSWYVDSAYFQSVKYCRQYFFERLHKNRLDRYPIDPITDKSAPILALENRCEGIVVMFIAHEGRFHRAPVENIDWHTKADRSFLESRSLEEKQLASSLVAQGNRLYLSWEQNRQAQEKKATRKGGGRKMKSLLQAGANLSNIQALSLELRSHWSFEDFYYSGLTVSLEPGIAAGRAGVGYAWTASCYINCPIFAIEFSTLYLWKPEAMLPIPIIQVPGTYLGAEIAYSLEYILTLRLGAYMPVDPTDSFIVRVGFGAHMAFFESR